MNEEISMMNVALVTGATGFIGSNLCNSLHDKGYTVYAVGVKEEITPRCHKLYEMPLERLNWKEIPNIDICFHQAANNDTTEKNYDKLHKANVELTFTLFNQLLQEKNCKNFIYASSCSIYGNRPTPYDEFKTDPDPLNPYAQSKMMMEMLSNKFAYENSVKTIGLRYTNVYGKDEFHKGKRASMIYQLIEKIKTNKVVKLFNYGDQKRDWVYVQDVVEANIKASKANVSGIYNVGSGVSTSFNEVIKIIDNILGEKTKIEYIECPFKEAYQNHTAVDLTRAKNDLNYFPIWSITEAIKDILKK